MCVYREMGEGERGGEREEEIEGGEEEEGNDAGEGDGRGGKGDVWGSGGRRGDCNWDIKELFWSILPLILLKDIVIDGFINIVSVSGMT